MERPFCVTPLPPMPRLWSRSRSVPRSPHSPPSKPGWYTAPLYNFDFTAIVVVATADPDAVASSSAAVVVGTSRVKATCNSANDKLVHGWNHHNLRVLGELSLLCFLIRYLYVPVWNSFYNARIFAKREPHTEPKILSDWALLNLHVIIISYTNFSNH